MKLDLLENSSWVAEIVCNIQYVGSAFGFLETGSYLIIRKSDGSISVHGQNKNAARNYLRSQTITIDHDARVIVCANKKEKLIITVAQVKWIQLLDLSAHVVAISRTEKELVTKFISNVNSWIPGAAGGEIIREFPIPKSGKVDVCIILDDHYHLVEAKRNKVTQKDISQVLRYRDHINVTNLALYILAPTISNNALDYASRNNVQFIELNWD